MKNPNAVELITTWNEGEYQVSGYWDWTLRHPENVSFTKEGAIKFCKENGYIICTRPR